MIGWRFDASSYVGITTNTDLVVLRAESGRHGDTPLTGETEEVISSLRLAATDSARTRTACRVGVQPKYTERNLDNAFIAGIATTANRFFHPAIQEDNNKMEH